MSVPAEVRVPFVDLARANLPLAAEFHEAFTRVMTTSAYVLGAEVDAFETAFAQANEARFCVGVASGTAAIGLALEAAGIGPGDEVIVPAHTFIASALGVLHAGATPRLCDVEAGTGLLDPAAVTAAIGPRTAAILAVHLYGRPCDMPALSALADRHGLLLFGDAAQAHGARCGGRAVGALGKASCFSFYPTKNLGALGDGGALCTGDEALAARARRLRNLGQRSKNAHVETGHNERLHGLQAALLSVKLTHLEAANARRREHASSYRSALAGHIELSEEPPGRPSVHHLFPVRHPDRDALAARLDALGVATQVHYSPALSDQPALRGHLAGSDDGFPEARAWAREELSLPMFAELAEHEVARVADAVHAATLSRAAA